MSDGIKQLELFRTPELTQAVETGILKILEAQERPSASELLSRLDNEVGVHGRFDVVDAILRLQTTKSLTREARRYLLNLIESGDLDLALRGPADKRREVESLVDDLLHASSIYRSSISFHGMIEFMGRFREYAPYNNMLVRIQNPSCSFYATEKDWRKRFGRHIQEDARPMLTRLTAPPFWEQYAAGSRAREPVARPGHPPRCPRSCHAATIAAWPSHRHGAIPSVCSSPPPSRYARHWRGEEPKTWTET